MRKIILSPHMLSMLAFCGKSIEALFIEQVIA